MTEPAVVYVVRTRRRDRRDRRGGIRACLALTGKAAMAVN